MKNIRKHHRNILAGVTAAILLLTACGNTSSESVSTENMSPGSVFSSDVFVEAVPGIAPEFLTAMDISSVIAEEESGVVYRDHDGTERDLFGLLADSGIRMVRVRVWNDPYDKDGHGYGGGNCDADKAAVIGKRAADSGMQTMIDFHFSDFWADPKKQMAPKAWEGMTADEKAESAYTYTKESLTKILSAGADVTIVQLGNEINYGMAGETQEPAILKILKRASEAVREAAAEQGKTIRIAVHFTQIDDAAFISRKAAWLKDGGLDYDIFGVSYYPYWHGSLANLSKVLTQTREDTGKDVMVLETAFPYTTEDGDFSGNSAGETAELGNYYVSVQGQTQAVRDVAAAASDGGAIGMCYWEGAWIPVPGDSKEAKQKLWEEKGSGWASSYAGAYDPGDAGKYYGGSSWENQAFFDFSGKALSSLDVFRGIFTGTQSSADPMSGYCKDPSAAAAPAEAETLLKNAGFEEEDISMWEVSYEGGKDPTDRLTKEADAKSGENAFHFWSDKAVEFTMKQTVSAPAGGPYVASAFMQGGDVGNDADIRFFVLVNGKEAGSDPVQLTGWVNWKEPVVRFTANAGDEISVGVSVKCAPGGWGTIDDVVLAMDTESAGTGDQETEAENPVGTPVVDLSHGYQIPEYVPGDRTVLDSYYHEKNELNVQIYNTIALDKFDSADNPDEEKIISDIQSSELPKELKPIAAEFAQTIMHTYPGIDMRCFDYNIRNMEVVYIEDQDTFNTPVSGAEAMFSIPGIQPYLNISRYMDPQEGNHDMIVLRHEFGHSLNICRFNKLDTRSGKYLYCDVMRDGYGFYIREACNVIVTTYPFRDRYEIEDLGIPLSGNVLRVILEATPGFDPRDLVTMDVRLLEEFVAGQNADMGLSAHDLFELIEAQSAAYYEDTNNSCYGVRDDFEKIYEYIGELYVKNVFYDGMPAEEVERYRELLKYDLTKCLKEEKLSLVHLDAIDEIFDRYLAEHG